MMTKLAKMITISTFLLIKSLDAEVTQTCLLSITEANKKAISYVGNTNPVNGRMQLELLLREGLQKDNYVLDLGCGALVAGIPIMSFLDQEHYVGIDPNKWLIDVSLHIKKNMDITLCKRPLFLYNGDFDARSTNITFDYIISHSIISHAAYWQLDLFLLMCSKVLKKGGKVIFSLRLTEPNEFGNEGALEETNSNKWVYPDNSFFHKETIIRKAAPLFNIIEHKKLYTELIMTTDKSAKHDWFVLTK